MSSHRHALVASATTATIFALAALPTGASAAERQRDLLGLPTSTLPVVDSLLSTVPIVGDSTVATTLPTLPGLDALTSVLSTVPVVGGSDPTLLSGTLPALPIGGSDSLSALTSALPDLTGLSDGLPVDGLPAGTVPTGNALAPVTALLRQVATALAGTPLADALNTLADQVDALGDNGVTNDLLTVLSSTLGSIAATPGVPKPVADQSAKLSTQLAPKPATTAATPPSPKKPVATTTTIGGGAGAPSAAVGAARLSSLKVDRAHGRIRVVLACSSAHTCKTILIAYKGTAVRGSSALLVVPARGTLTKNVKLDSTGRRLLKNKRTRFTVVAVLPGGKFASRTVSSKAPVKQAKKGKQARKAARR
ncbi:hypothetical protein NBH00_06960 [Paraconexibacter antarcticus]|uniref:Uncharacterized protein n=1 Tax=Paraconexibacter antarcticus TaxID=2949664 RepID=A0ABY5DV98_9ACTN|nr:hypothetical protein [Paraconexibacter antarcticus]UTI65943.1 hypothetical protein NBH00_06960 [Paraconexibacter antarcticus]